MTASDYIEFGIVGHFWTIQPILCMSKIFTNFNKSEEQYRKLSPIKIKFSTENEYVNGIQKFPQQNFSAYEDL